MTHVLTSGAKWQYVEHLGLIQMFVYVFAIRNLILLIRPNSGLILKIRPNACHHLKNLCTLGLRPKFGLRTKSDLFYQVTHWMNCAYQTLFWYVLKCSLSAHWIQLVIFVTFNLNYGLYTFSDGKPSEQMWPEFLDGSDFQKPNPNQFSVFAHP